MIVLPDADRPGLAHAERVAEACWNLPMRLQVKVIALPALTAGTDAFDWLHGGHSADELMKVVAAASYWSPGALERAREDRKRALTRDRVRRWKAREKAKRRASGLESVTQKRGNAA